MVTLAQFDNRYELVYDNTPIDYVGPLVLEPRGSAALYDAVSGSRCDFGVGSPLPKTAGARGE